jgi:polyisoprenyl-teichoic acid--peptidoglycan teichoic acid transferase
MRFRLAGRRFTLAQALAITAASAVLPGTAHLCAGHRRSGATLVSAYLAVVAFCGLVAATHWPGVVELSTRPRVPILLLIVAAAWVALLVRSYLLLRPPGLPMGSAAGGGAAVAAICLLVVAPALTAAEYAPSHPAQVRAALVAAPVPGPAPAAVPVPVRVPAKPRIHHAKHHAHAVNTHRYSVRRTRIVAVAHPARHHAAKKHHHAAKHRPKPKHH